MQGVTDTAAQAGLQLVLPLLPAHDFYCSAPLVCKVWHAAAATAYASRPLVTTPFQVSGPAKRQSLATWLQWHGRHLVQLQLGGFRTGTSQWWHNVLCSHFNTLKQLSLRACGSPELPLHLLVAPNLCSMRLEHLPAPPAPAAIAALKQLRQLSMRNCMLGVQHLAAVAKLSQLVQLDLAQNMFVASPAESHVDALPTLSCGSVASSVPANDDDSNIGNAAHKHYQAVTTICRLPNPAAAPAGTADALAAVQPSNWLINLDELQSLDLSHCRLGAGLLESLPALTQLRRLYLGNAALDASPSTDRFQLQLRQRHQQSAVLTYANHMLGFYAVTAPSFDALVRANSIVEVDLSCVPNACQQLCAAASSVNKQLSIESLNVSSTGCSNEHLQQLAQCCPKLKRLNVSSNSISTAGIAMLNSSCRQLTSLESALCE